MLKPAQAFEIRPSFIFTTFFSYLMKYLVCKCVGFCCLSLENDKFIDSVYSPTLCMLRVCMFLLHLCTQVLNTHFCSLHSNAAIVWLRIGGVRQFFFWFVNVYKKAHRDNDDGST